MSGGTASTQIRNTELVDILSVDFQRRYEAAFTWGNVCSMFQMLPGLRGFWPMSSFDEAGWAHDLSGQGRVLEYNGNPTYNAVGLIPYIDLDGTGDYLSRPDEAGLDIIGTETSIAAALRGLTVGGWFYRDSIATAMGLIAKYMQTGDQRSWLLRGTNTGAVTFYANSTGAAAGDVFVTSSNTVAASNWLFVLGRFDPSTEINVWVNGTETVNAVGTPASLFNSTAEVDVGAWNNGGSEYLNGRASLCFLCATYLPDRYVKAIYEHSRPLFGG